MRFATLEDFPRVTHLLREYLLEQAKDGSPIQVTRRTLEAYRDLARSYLAGSLAGVVVLDGPEDHPTAFGMCGEDGSLPRWDTNLGRLAIIWCVWTEPGVRRKDTALQVLHFGLPRMRELGFDTVSFGVRESNLPAQGLTDRFGAHLVERVYRFNLKDKPNGQ